MTRYETRRLVLRQRPGAEMIAQLADSAEWTLLADNADQPYSDRTREQSYGVRHGIHVYSISDVLTGCCAVSVIADDVSEANEFLDLLAGHLQPITTAELHENFSNISDPIDRLLRLIQLALSASEEFDPAIFDRISQAAGDQDERVRDTVTLAAGYVAWPQVRRILRDLATNDPHEGVRRDARFALDTYDRAGVADI